MLEGGDEIVSVLRRDRWCWKEEMRWSVSEGEMVGVGKPLEGAMMVLNGAMVGVGMGYGWCRKGGWSVVKKGFGW